jgi:hypothetical protein
MGISTNFGLSLTAFLFAVLVMPSSGRAQSYNPASAFELGFTTQHNPNGVWSYGYSSAFTSPITLYDQTTQNGVNGPNAQYWLSPAVDVGTSPAAEYNDGPAYNDGNVDFLANEFLLVAGIGGQYSNLVFTAPADGAYSIVSQFRGAQYGIGTVVAVVANGTVLFNSSVTSVGQLVPFNTTVSLKAGSTLRFSVGPGAGLQNTGLSLNITKTCALKDTLSYNATSGNLTMAFIVGTPSAATWNTWLTFGNKLVLLWSQSLPITEPPIKVTKTHALAKSGTVGVLSTLTAPIVGITCSSWQTVNTGP